MSAEKKDASNQNGASLGRWWTQHPPKTTSGDSAQPGKLLKGKKEVISVNHGDGDQRPHPPPLYAGLSTSCDFSLDAILFTRFVHEITTGEAGEEIW